MTPIQAERVAWLIQDVAVCVREHDEVRGIHARNELIRLLTTEPAAPAPDTEAVRLLREVIESQDSHVASGGLAQNERFARRDRVDRAWRAARAYLASRDKEQGNG